MACAVAFAAAAAVVVAGTSVGFGVFAPELSMAAEIKVVPIVFVVPVVEVEVSVGVLAAFLSVCVGIACCLPLHPRS